MKHFYHTLIVAAGLTSCALAQTSVQVVLPYETHQAIVNDDDGVYNFTNIPFGESPVGDLRFAMPVPRTTNTSGINYGTNFTICPQVLVGWGKQYAIPFIEAYEQSPLEPGGNIKQWTDHAYGTPWDYGPVPDGDPRIGDDCLLLDVVVPKKVFDNKNGTNGVPVLVWFFGGGYIEGHKNQMGMPGEFFDAMQSPGDEFIFVTFNYRVGALGWLAAINYTTDGGAPNAGFWDQRLAIDWVHEYINLFGGDASQITVMGESAGASSIMHHLTASGGTNSSYKPRFNRAILQSPAFFPQGGNQLENAVYAQFLTSTGATDLKTLRNLPAEQIWLANAQMIWNSNYGQFTFGPGLDGSFVDEPPALHLSKNEVWPDVEILVANNGDEGILFTPPNIQTDDDMRTQISTSFPLMTAGNITAISEMYPLVNTSFPRRDWVKRFDSAITDLAVVCNTYLLLQAYNASSSYKYVFHAFPGLHGQDVSFTFYHHPPADGDTPNPLKVSKKNCNLALGMQSYIANFVLSGKPEGPVFNDTTCPIQPPTPDFPPYSSGSATNNVVLLSQKYLQDATFTVTADTADPTKCAFWGTAPYYKQSEGDEKKRYAHRAWEQQNMRNALKKDGEYQQELRAEL